MAVSCAEYCLRSALRPCKNWRTFSDLDAVDGYKAGR